MTDAFDPESVAAGWIARRDRGEWSEDDQCRLDAWLAESFMNRVAYLRLQSAWDRADRLRALRTTKPPRPSDAPAPRVERRRQAALRLAAGIAFVCIGLSLSGDLNLSGSGQHYSTPIGARETVALADGSRLTLNSGTQLRTIVNDRERSVWLDEGEAYFDVAHDAGRPFVVFIGERRVTVLGTRFTLRREVEGLQVNVLEGRVQVQVEGNVPTASTLLTRGESAVGVGPNLLVKQTTERQSLAATSWLEGRLVFDQMTLAEAAAQFNRYNTKKLVIADPAAGSIRIGGSFDANNVEAFARLVQSGFGLDLQVRDGEIFALNPSR